MKQKNRFRLLVGFLLLFGSGFCLSAGKISQVFVIKGVPKTASLLPENSEELKEGSILISNQYSVRLDSVTLVKGKAKITNEVTVQLSASHVESVTGQKEIFAVVQQLDGESLKVLYWGVPQSIICVPNGLMINTNLERSFSAFERYDGSKCSSLN
ncbi:hypothetical protein [Microbulbifer discodermiae]|uniref:hypothetical protein n=1 Tax=Microbulbifer sp. 2201CG32-9 TaxID=3232309 RepID=UPI00345C3400